MRLRTRKHAWCALDHSTESQKFVHQELQTQKITFHDSMMLRQEELLCVTKNQNRFFLKELTAVGY